MKSKTLFTSSCLLLAGAIVLGAFAAHGLKEKVSPYHIDIFQKGVFYLMIHAMVMLFLSFHSHQLKSKGFKTSVILFTVGIALFSGSLFLLGGLGLEKEDALARVVGPVTPFGGLSFIAGWVVLAFSYKGKS